MYWIVSELFYPDEVSTAQILTDIAIKKNEQTRVSVICGPVGYESSYNHQEKEFDQKIKVYRVSIPRLDKNFLFQRVIRLFILSVKISWKVLFMVKKTDTILFTTNPAFLLLILPILKQLKGFNLEVLVHDVFPENLVPAGLIKKNSLRFKIISRIYNRSYKKVDRIIVLGQDMRQLLNEKIGHQPQKIDVIANWPDSNIYPLPDLNIKDYLGIDTSNRIVLSFAGNLGRVQGLLEFIDLFISSDNKNLILVIFGDGALRTLIMKKVIDESFDNIHYLGPRPRSEQNLFLNACHIGIITLKSGMKGLGVPSKTYNLMAAGKPLLYIGDNESEIDNYVSRYECGWSFSWEEKGEIIKFLRELSLEKLHEINNKGEMSIRASKNFEKNYLLKQFE